MRLDVITIEQADEALSTFSDWLELSDQVKTNHIKMASSYVQTKWTCTDIDWEDDETIPDEVVEAIAYFALASSYGNLYGSVSDTGYLAGKIKKTRSKVGSLEDEVEYFQSVKTDFGTKNPLGYPTAIMDFFCTTNIYLERV